MRTLIGLVVGLVLGTAVSASARIELAFVHLGPREY